eukprot:GFYU01016348.1.p1 GENE.GFYU01016348.1~~GFYU01016348.1.p1  ORF type:complete len:120 (+),score=42.22 GFYU01016348.1:3-362(+)
MKVDSQGGVQRFFLSKDAYPKSNFDFTQEIKDEQEVEIEGSNRAYIAAYTQESGQVRITTSGPAALEPLSAEGITVIALSTALGIAILIVVGILIHKEVQRRRGPRQIDTTRMMGPMAT